jgi:hypothetical protein
LLAPNAKRKIFQARCKRIRGRRDIEKSLGSDALISYGIKRSVAAWKAEKKEAKGREEETKRGNRPNKKKDLPKGQEALFRFLALFSSGRRRFLARGGSRAKDRPHCCRASLFS